jgi:hypothetical protein
VRSAGAANFTETSRIGATKSLATTQIACDKTQIVGREMVPCRLPPTSTIESLLRAIAIFLETDVEYSHAVPGDK